MPNRTVRAIAWLHARRGKINRLILKAAGFYFGYRVLHHEIYEADSAEPILVGLGLWLCGVPVATFFDGLKKLGAGAQEQVEAVTGQDGAKQKLESSGKTPGESGRTT